jgi:hypothetical protein
MTRKLSPVAARRAASLAPVQPAEDEADDHRREDAHDDDDRPTIRAAVVREEKPG